MKVQILIEVAFDNHETMLRGIAEALREVSVISKREKALSVLISKEGERPVPFYIVESTERGREDDGYGIRIVLHHPQETT